MGCNVLGNTQLFLNTLDWEFIIEKKESKHEINNTFDQEKRTRSRKHALVQESVHEKNYLLKKTCTQPEKRTRKKNSFKKNDNGQESYQETKLTKLSVKKIKERFK